MAPFNGCLQTRPTARPLHLTAQSFVTPSLDAERPPEIHFVVHDARAATRPASAQPENHWRPQPGRRLAATGPHVRHARSGADRARDLAPGSISSIAPSGVLSWTRCGRRHSPRRRVVAVALAAFTTLRAQAPPTRSVVPPLDVAIGSATRLLVISPHPDDETLGAAGLIRRVVASGGAVRVVWMTSGDGFPEGVETDGRHHASDGRRTTAATAASASARRGTRSARSASSPDRSRFSGSPTEACASWPRRTCRPRRARSSLPIPIASARR